MSRLLWIIIILAIIIGGFWLWSIKKEGGPDTEGLPRLDEVSETDTTTQIQLDLNAVNLGDIDAEFQNIDADLNNL